MRRYCLYTSAPPASPKSFQQIRQPHQVLVAKEGPTGGDLHERVVAADIRTTRDNRLQAAFAIEEKHAILTPRFVVVDQFEVVTEQRMKGMRYPKEFGRTALMRCI